MGTSSEDLAYSIAATDRRLCEVECHSHYSSSHKHGTSMLQIFSAQWDTNDPDTILLSHTNGLLRIYNTLAQIATDYRLMTQPLDLIDKGPPSSASSTRYVASHWDKFTTIPNAPGRLLFLCGVSRYLYYSSIPSSSLPSSSSSSSSPSKNHTRGDFLFGKDVLQLWSHNTRITALAVSLEGILIATGDERGGIKLAPFHRITSLLSQTGSKAYSQETAQSSPGITCFQAHSNSIFTLLWLPSSSSSSSSSSDAAASPALKAMFCTGSSDFTLKIWCAHCSSSFSEMRIVCIRTFTTLTSHVLSMSSCRLGTFHSINNLK